jgi:hypothetical protein
MGHVSLSFSEWRVFGELHFGGWDECAEELPGFLLVDFAGWVEALVCDDDGARAVMADVFGLAAVEEKFCPMNVRGE